ncbi:MAG: NAD kinase [Streptococcaceae bacterium]|nr:NAD kinase [Streptococcaceae bacterium]
MNSGNIKKIKLIGNSSPESIQTLLELKSLFEKEGFGFDEIDPEIVISIGGDGTLLRAMHLHENQLNKIRFIGVHTGHLGFYTDFTNTQLDEIVETVKNEDSALAIRYPLLKVEVAFQNGEIKKLFALNESTFRRSSRTLVADVRISDFLLEKFRGDGLSVATPTGSTAYNKSIGGAVMHPQVEAMQLAEIASLNNRIFRTLGAPMIVGKKDKITVAPEKFEGELTDCILTVDHLAFTYEKIQSITYSLNGGSIAFANGSHLGFWERVKNSFIGEEE